MNRLLLLLVLVALAAAACGDSGETAVEGVTITTAAATTTEATTTEATTTTMAAVEAPAIVAGEDPDVDAIVLAYQIAFDSESDYAAKAPFIDDPSGLEETVAKYLATGDSFGGIAVLPTAVTIDGDTAEVGYDLLFGGNPGYPDQSGTAIKTPDGWKVPRTVFCSLMSSARVGCP